MWRRKKDEEEEEKDNGDKVQKKEDEEEWDNVIFIDLNGMLGCLSYDHSKDTCLNGISTLLNVNCNTLFGKFEFEIQILFKYYISVTYSQCTDIIPV